MGYNVYSLRSGYGRKSSETREFYEAMDMAKEGLEKVCELAEEMAAQYGERGGSYGSRGRYGSREEWDEMEEMYGDRRRRDSMGRYR